jgi:signal transduction histidine kinase
VAMPEPVPFRVLVVEDDAGTRANMRDILEMDAYRVETAATAAEALHRDDWHEISAILLDRNLPDGRAEELLPRLRQLAPETAILIVTGYADLESSIAALRLGVVDYLLKPINVDLLRASLARLAERHRLAAELREAQQRALQAERLAAIGEAMTGLVHESRNALQRSQAGLERLARRVKDQPEALDLIALIQKAQDDLHRLYEEVREYAAPIRISPVASPIDRIVREAWEDLAARRRERIASLEEHADTPDLRCEVDPFALRRVFRNILENSLDAGADPVKITVRYTAVQEGRLALRIVLGDNGPGLTPEQRPRIFDAFYTTKTHGTGLGLAIVKRLVEIHQGTITVGAGPGAEMRITLPRRQS